MNYSLSMDKQFRPLDPNAQIHVSQRHLPHWYQPGAAVFVTFRTVDSMPRDVLLRWHQELVGWLRSAELPKRMADAVLGHRAADHDQMLERLSSAQRAEFKKLINRNTGQSGAFWQAEPFDHVIRSESQFLYLQQYIFDNPTKAKLPAGHFLYWQR